MLIPVERGEWYQIFTFICVVFMLFCVDMYMCININAHGYLCIYAYDAYVYTT